MLGATNSGDMKFKTDEWRQGISELLNVMKASCTKPPSYADVTYIYSSAL